jgi:hypothetical protein
LAPVMKMMVFMNPACATARETARDGLTVGKPVPPRPAGHGG